MTADPVGPDPGVCFARPAWCDTLWHDPTDETEST